MHPAMLISLAAFLLASTGCSRRSTQIETEKVISSTYEATEESQVAAETETPSPQKIRPERELARRAHEERRARRAALDSDKSAHGREVHSSADSIPETTEQAEYLMQRLDRDIATQELTPEAARQLRSAFRGRLLAAGVPQATIEAWAENRFTP